MAAWYMLRMPLPADTVAGLLRFGTLLRKAMLRMYWPQLQVLGHGLVQEKGSHY